MDQFESRGQESPPRERRGDKVWRRMAMTFYDKTGKEMLVERIS